jgi:hypothetical protein
MKKVVKMVSQERSDLAATALRYLAQGWASVPVELRSKHPVVRWEEFQHRLPSRGEVDTWFRNRSDLNIAIVTGRVSGLVVLDVDPGHGGAESLSKLEATHGALPRTVEVVTGGGGRHLYFAHPGELVRSHAGLEQGLDIRGDGGLVVAPPSLHASGQRYRWKHPPEQIEIAPLPSWVLDYARDDTALRGHPRGYWRRRIRRRVEEGERNSTIASLTGHLLWRGVDVDVIIELLLCWNRIHCRPPLPDDEVVRTIRSVSRTHRRQRRSDERDGGDS